MGSIIDHIREDSSAGIQIDKNGRRYFRSRRVRFQTLYMDAEELHTHQWDQFTKSLQAPWSDHPSYQALVQFAAGASERYLAMWYHIFDVAAARGLYAKDRFIFRVPFFAPSSFADTGIPEDFTWSSVEKELHQKIIKEYKESKYGNVNNPDFVHR